MSDIRRLRRHQHLQPEQYLRPYVMNLNRRTSSSFLQSFLFLDHCIRFQEGINICLKYQRKSNLTIRHLTQPSCNYVSSHAVPSSNPPYLTTDPTAHIRTEQITYLPNSYPDLSYTSLKIPPSPTLHTNKKNKKSNSIAYPTLSPT